ncbi:MAG TPA: hypothetical protein VJ279_08475 [Hanamia sp.]|nr:hypothetical protein [Hanamia sp.]
MSENKFIPLEQVTKPMLTTQEAAHYLNRKPQTLRIWACNKTGAVKPLNIQGRLGWKTEDIKKLLGI